MFLESESERLPYSHDSGSAAPHLPDIVILPQKPSEIGIILKIATAHRIPITVRGAGTGTTGGAIPACGGIVISMEKLNRILEIDTANAMLVAEPGVLTQTIHQTAESHGLFYPPDPASSATCTIGGNVAENAGGPRALKYGVTEQYVTGLAGYYADGTAFKLGGKLLKNVAGYNLLHLLIGSEGTLAIITQITLRLLPLPSHRQSGLAVFPSFESALNTLIRIEQTHIQVCAAEFLDPTCLTAAQSYLKRHLPYPKGQAYILFQIDGFSAEAVTDQKNQVLAACQASGSIADYFPATPAEEAALWETRHCLSLALKTICKEKFSHDIVVPRAQVPAYMTALTTLSHTATIQILGYGHLGDGNIHVNVLNQSCTETEWTQHKHELSHKICQLAVDLGGSITGEHGVGLTKKVFMKMMFSDHDLMIMKGIKTALDPLGILNPGKVIE